MKEAALLILPFALLAVNTRAAQPNIIRNGDFEEEALDGWQPGENVSIEATTEKVHSGNRAIKLAWHDVTEMPWGRGGNLCGARGIITQNLKEDMRYRVRCFVLVDEFHVADESRKWLAEEPPGKYDAPTVTIGCFGGYWTSRMPWVAYDISKLGTWQEMEFEFTTPFNTVRGRGQSGAECFRLHFDVYPNQTGPMRSSGVMYIDSFSLEECPPRVGFTKTKGPIGIDGDLEDWWETNPTVITCDQAADGRRAANRSGSGIFYTMWDEERLYVAAKVIDEDVVPGEDGIAVWVNGREWFVSSRTVPEGCTASVRPVEGLGSTANMYRIVTQFGEEVRGRSGYVVEAAISGKGLGIGGPISEITSLDVAFEIRDVDEQGDTRRLYFPHNGTSGTPVQTAAAVFANEKGETRGGEYPQYAATDAGNPRTPGGGPDLAVKNVTGHVVRGGRLGYTVAPYHRGDSDKVDAVISWTTNWPASGSVRYGLDSGYGKEVKAADGIGNGSGIALRAVLRDLEPNRKYHFQVFSRSIQNQKKLSDDFILDTALREVEGIEYGRIPLTVTETANAGRQGWPVTSGVPFPKGQLGSVQHLRILDAGGSEIPAQFLQTAEWDDGSVKWVLVDFQADFAAKESSQYVLEYGTKIQVTSPKTSLRVSDEQQHVAVDTGAIQFVINKSSFALFDEVHLGDRLVAQRAGLSMVDGEGTTYTAGKPDLVEVEELGPMRVCIRAKGPYMAEDGAPLFDYEVRIHAFAGKPYVRVVHNYVCHMEQGAPENRNEIKIRSMSIEVPLVGSPLVDSPSPKCLFGTDAGGPLELNVRDTRVEARQAHESEATVGGKPFKRLPGWVAVNDTLVAVEHFWQLYPKALTVWPGETGPTIRINTMPPLEFGAYPSEPNMPEDYVHGYLEGGRYRLRPGEGRSHQIFLTFGVTAKKAEQLATAQTSSPLMAVAKPEWYCGTKAAGYIHPRDVERFGAMPRAS